MVSMAEIEIKYLEDFTNPSQNISTLFVKVSVLFESGKVLIPVTRCTGWEPMS